MYDNLNRRNENFAQNDEYEEPTEPTKTPKNPLDFCENPEDIRARAAERRRTRDEKRYRGSQQPSNLNLIFHFNGHYAFIKFFNVSGKASNSTNEGDRTNRDRHLKNVHKSSSGNHNRRYLSDRKRKF